MLDHEYKLVCGENECTACGACVQICPKECITYQANNHETLRAVINNKDCISCNLCKKVCPQLNVIEGNKSKECYAGWSNDNEIKLNSASGGIATELYKYYADIKGYYAGVLVDESMQVSYKLVSGKEKYNIFQNSKYVHSDTKDVFKNIAEVLKKDNKVLFIGLPCQVAGLQRYLQVKKIDDTKLMTVDLVCHGTTPNKFLIEHIKYIEQKKNKNAQELRFRDPNFGTQYFVFSLYENNKVFYHKRVNRNDYYQIGYHSGISYRDNCYTCKYATNTRMGDISLADFSGVGSIDPCNYTGRNVSCILINTDKGKELIADMKADDYIYCESRPIEEELNTEGQLHRPTAVTNERKIFLHSYELEKSFELAMKEAARKICVKNELKYFLCIEKIKNMISCYMPSNVKKLIKRLLNRA